MNHTPFRNLLKYIIACFLYYSGISKLLLLSKLKNGLYVFNYHNFNTFTNSYWRFGSLYETGYKDQFKKHIEFYSRYLFRVKTFRLDRIVYDRPYFFLTFDDGYKDNINVAFPVLCKKRIPAVFFVTTDYVGSEKKIWFDQVRWYFEQFKTSSFIKNILVKKRCRQTLNYLKANFQYGFPYEAKFSVSKKTSCHTSSLMMDWDDLEMAARRGIAVAPHTCSHPVLSKLRACKIFHEIDRSKRVINKRVKFLSSFFCYPDGSFASFNSQVVDTVVKCGFKFAFTTINGFNVNVSDPYKLKRIGINPSDPVPVVALKIIIASVLSGNENSE